MDKTRIFEKGKLRGDLKVEESNGRAAEQHALERKVHLPRS